MDPRFWSEYLDGGGQIFERRRFLIMYGTGRLTWVGGSWVAAGLLFVACAGGDTPPRPPGFSDELRAAYADEAGASGAAGSAGSSSGGGAGGTSSSGAGGTASSPPVGAAGTGSGLTGGAGTGTGSAGTGSGSSGAGSSANVCDAPTTVFTPICGTSGCHGDGSTIGDFGASEAAAKALLDKPVPSGATCGKFIDSTNPNASLVLTMTADNPPKGCYMVPMPLGKDALTSEQTACITSWLSQF